MLDNTSATDHQNGLSFESYILKTRQLIQERRVDLATAVNPQLIINANCPYELKPLSSKAKCGALFIHGLLDSPFSVLDLATRLQAKGLLCRSILLPGHGTKPEDLISISYKNWIEALRYGIHSMKSEVDHLFLVGYSTGGALSVYQALLDDQIAGLVLLAPAIGLHTSANLAIIWNQFKKKMGINRNPWIIKSEEIDYVKYRSITFNAVTEVSLLIQLVHNMRQIKKLSCPIFLVSTENDETISNQKALKFFTQQTNPLSQLLLYTPHPRQFDDSRIVTRSSSYPDLCINHFSHISIAFSPQNPHYGQEGDYPLATRRDQYDQSVYGAYNKVQTHFYNDLFKVGMIKKQKNALTYNPDFDFMMGMIETFIERSV